MAVVAVTVPRLSENMTVAPAFETLATAKIANDRRDDGIFMGGYYADGAFHT
jgi:hypothetical protein